MFLHLKTIPIATFLCVIALTIQSILHFYVSGAISIIDTSSSITFQGVTLPTSLQLLPSLSSGDFNGDGYGDILIGQPTADQASLSETVYVIFGTANGIPNIDLSSTILNDNDGIQIYGLSGSQLGYSVAGLGDINGDNVDDFIIGAPNAGKAFVIFGKTDGQLSSIYSPDDISTNNQGIVISGQIGLGSQVSSAGDFNNDGINDFMVSLYTDMAISSQGTVYVIFGQVDISSSFDLIATTLDPSQGFQIVGTELSRLGMSLSKAGDFNGDGIDDIMAGTSALDSGMVVIVYGTAAPDSTVQTDPNILLSSQGVIITGSSSSLIGSMNSISSVGDVNNDGIDDIALGVPYYSDNSASNYGMVYIVYGAEGGFSVNIGLSSPDWNGFQIYGELTSDWNFGISVTSADINADGLSDLVVGSLGGTNSWELNVGKTYVFFGNTNGFSAMDVSNLGTPSLPQVLQVYGDGADSKLGNVVGSGTDLNKDGVYDLVILGAQQAYVVYGSQCARLTDCNSADLSPICYASQGCICGESSLYFQETGCVSGCSEGYYAYTAICELCPTGCSSCTSASVCQSCSDGYVFLGTSCASSCPTSYYLGDQTCQTCPTGCSSCTSASTCQSCSDGYVLNGTSCESSCPTGYYFDGQTCQSDDVSGLSEAQTIGSITGTTQVVNSATLAAASLVAANDPGSVTVSILAKMLQYIQFWDLPYSQRLVLTFKNHNSTYGPYGIGPKMPEKLQLDLPYHNIPDQFTEYNVTSNFLVNFWDSTIFLAIIIGMLLLSKLVECSIAKIKKKPMPIIRVIRTSIQNFFFMQFYNVFGDILLFLTLDFKKVMLVNSEAALSFCLAIFFLCMGCTILAWHIYILMKLSKSRKSTSEALKPGEFEKKYNGSTALFVNFKEMSIVSQSFLLVFVLRNCLFNLVLALLSDYPRTQAIIIFVMSVLILLYLLIQRPFKSLINLFQQITCEVFLLTANTCILILAQIDFQTGNHYPFRDSLCEVIIYTSLIFSFVPQIFLALKLGVAVILKYKEYRKKSSNKNPAKVSQLEIKNRIRENSSTSASSQNKSLNESSTGLQMAHNVSNIVLPDDEASFAKSPTPRSFSLKDKIENAVPGSNNSQGIQLQDVVSTYTSKQIRTYNQQSPNPQADINNFGISERKGPKRVILLESAKTMGTSKSHLPKWKIARKVFNPE